MSISLLARQIAPSPTLALNEEARILREKGEAVIHLGAGEPKNKAPISAILSSAAKLSEGDIKYTPTEGIPSLRKAIVRYTEENYNKVVAPENILVSGGAKQALYNVLYALLNPKDEVIVLAPYWVSYPEMIMMMQAKPVIVKPEDGSFHPRMEDILKYVTPYTKVMILNSPNNPSGAVFSDEFIQQIVEFCESKGIYLIMDDIYHKLVFDGVVPASCYKFMKKDLESSTIITINGVSKLYGMTGFRVGWVIAPRKLIGVLINIQAQTTSCTSLVLQAAAEGALTGVQSVIQQLKMMLENNRNVMVRELQAFNGLHLVPPKGTYYCLPDFRAYINDSLPNSTALSRFLLQKALVVTVPGNEFGLDGYLRLSYCGTIKEIKEGIERIKWALDPTAPNEIYIGERKMVRDWL